MKNITFVRPQNKTYLYSFACLHCHKSFKYADALFKENNAWRMLPNRKCPQCRSFLVNLGRHFKPPEKTNIKQWEKVKFLVDHNFFFQKLYDKDGNLIPYPATLKEAKEFVIKYQDLALKARKTKL